MKSYANLFKKKIALTRKLFKEKRGQHQLYQQQQHQLPQKLQTNKLFNLTRQTNRPTDRHPMLDCIVLVTHFAPKH